ncbi:MAG TPA: hypothetical protein VK988_09560, partial [Acidimicrobiales bacterium]|nr:hypothetical protein [Acidimicrobiales bacterium]
MGGHQAPGEVAAALGILAGAGVDVVVVARGGGARSDFAPWDSGSWPRPSPVVRYRCGWRSATRVTT